MQRILAAFTIVAVLASGPVVLDTPLSAEDAEYTKINFPRIRNVKKTKESYDGKKVRILGWMVPVDAATDIKYFLLVSNSRYCVHVPAPPINQIVFVEVKQTAALVSGAPVIVKGDLQVSRKEHQVFGPTIYILSADSVERAY